MKVDPVNKVQYVSAVKSVNNGKNTDILITNKKQGIETDTQKKEISLEKLQESVEVLNKTVNVIDKKYEFYIHKETDRPVVRVLERATGEVINQIPPDEILNIITRIREIIGVFIDERV